MLKTVLTILIAMISLAVVPGFASAETHFDFTGSRQFTVSGGSTTYVTSAGKEIKCSTTTGSGEFEENGKSGNIELTFHSCKGPLNTNCTTPGQMVGTITTTNLGFYIVEIPGKGPGLLLVPNEIHYFTAKCAFILTVVVGGNGIVGLMTAPEYEVSSETATFKFSATEEGEQEDTTIEGSETEYWSEAEENGEEAVPGGLNTEFTTTFKAGGKGLLTE